VLVDGRPKVKSVWGLSNFHSIHIWVDLYTVIGTPRGEVVSCLIYLLWAWGLERVARNNVFQGFRLFLSQFNPAIPFRW